MAFARYLLGILLLITTQAHAQAAVQHDAIVSVLDRQGRPIAAITDGDLISLRVRFARAVPQPATISFGLQAAARPVAACTVAGGDTACTTEALPALGWYWSDERQAQSRRTIQAMAGDATVGAAEIEIAPRPVVLVHGFISSAATWAEYTRLGGFLASLGLAGYAVGDGQAPGVLRIGDVKQPTQPTNSIAQNAAVLAQYIGSIKQRTGAQQVDLVAHSMGGLIARYYLDRLMPQRDVAQLLMLGTSHGGSPCAQLPASLGWYLPAALELRPAYVGQIFNRQVTRRHGVPFRQFAGTSIVEEFKSPCTVVPSDLVVDRGSVSSIAAPVTELPEVHTALTKSADVFATFVAPQLRTAAGMFPSEPDPPPQAATGELQFSKLLSGRVAAGASEELTIELDQVAVAGFALFDPTRSLSLEVRGASGRAITLDPVIHGMVVLDDPSALFNLGYGFRNPAPGPWKIVLAATPATPPDGAPYAISTRVVGGATLHTGIDRTVPEMHDTVVVSGSLEIAGRPQAAATIDALVRAPDGTTERHALNGAQPAKQLTLAPGQTGIYTLDITAHGRAEDGSPVDRSAFLAFEVQPSSSTGRRSLLAIAAGAAVPLVGAGMWLVYRRRRAHRT